MISAGMILNEQELKEARSRISLLDGALTSEAALEPMIAGLPPEVVEQVMRAMKAERVELESLCSAYEDAKTSGNYAPLQQRTSGEPGIALIVARIARGLSQRELAWRLGLKEQQIQRYEADRYSTISLKNYQKIAVLLGVTLRAEISELTDFVGLDKVIDAAPKSSLRKILKHGRENGWFAADAEEAELWRFIAENRITFGSPTLLRTGFNVKDHSDDLLLHAWRARVATIAQGIIAEVKPQFDRLQVTWLTELVRLSRYDDGPKLAVSFLLQNGIVVVIERQIPGLEVDGAAFLEGEIPIIGLTLRRDSLDNFWFTLLHEVGHAILHYRTGLAVGFFDQTDAESVDLQEHEADSFARNLLIPEEAWRRSTARISNSTKSIADFALSMQIHPAIVFGRIRKERDNYALFSKNIGQNEVRRHFLDSER